MEFSKKIVLWAMAYATVVTCAMVYIFAKKGIVSSEIIGLTGTVVTGVVVAYMAKAATENFQKIKNGGNKDE